MKKVNLKVGSTLKKTGKVVFKKTRQRSNAQTIKFLEKEGFPSLARIFKDF